MPHTTICNPDTGIIEIKGEGNITLTEIKEIYAEATDISAKTGALLFLSDYSEATVKLSTIDIYELPKFLVHIAESVGVNAYKFKRAMIPSKDAESFQFYETVTTNRGQLNIRLFQSVEAAREWLLQE